MRELRDRWPTAQEFVKYHGVDLQIDAVKNPRSYLTGRDFTLREVEMVYTSRVADYWLSYQLTHVMETDRPADEVKEQVKLMLYKLGAVMYNNTCREIILFLGEMSVGKYGKMYGQMNVADMLDMVQKFQNGLFKRKQHANEEIERENGPKVKADLNFESIIHSDKELQRYLYNAPKDSILAYLCQKFGWGYEIPQECKDNYKNMKTRMEEVFKPCYMR